MELRYDGFAKCKIRQMKASDYTTTLYRAKASIIDYKEDHSENQQHSADGDIPELFTWGSRAPFFVPEIYATFSNIAPTNKALCIEIVGTDNLCTTIDRLVVRKLRVHVFLHALCG